MHGSIRSRIVRPSADDRLKTESPKPPIPPPAARRAADLAPAAARPAAEGARPPERPPAGRGESRKRERASVRAPAVEAPAFQLAGKTLPALRNQRNAHVTAWREGRREARASSPR